MDGSRFNEVLLESGICTSGSINGVMKGKHYNRALRTHLAVCKALERLLLERFFSSEDSSNILTDDVQKLPSNPHDDPSKEFLDLSFEDTSLIHLFYAYQKFQKEVASGVHGKTAQFWLSYMNHVELIMRFLIVTKKNILEIYQACINSMSPLFFTFGSIKYARYLSFYSVLLQNIDQTHPGAKELLEKGALSVARSLLLGCRNPVDLTTEQTFMKYAKSKGGGTGVGIIGITKNHKAYQRWVLT